VAIAAINVLEWLMDIERHADNSKLAWVVAILLSFAAAMLLLAIADRVSGATNGGDPEDVSGRDGPFTGEG
jgi:uncharacterized membrane protein YqhA